MHYDAQTERKKDVVVTYVDFQEVAANHVLLVFGIKLEVARWAKKVGSAMAQMRSS